MLYNVFCNYVCLHPYVYVSVYVCVCVCVTEETAGWAAANTYRESFCIQNCQCILHFVTLFDTFAVILSCCGSAVCSAQSTLNATVWHWSFTLRQTLHNCIHRFHQHVSALLALSAHFQFQLLMSNLVLCRVNHFRLWWWWAWGLGLGLGLDLVCGWLVVMHTHFFLH